ncbi:MFS transporter [Neisseria weixii]|nr:MFS transporter [Neisseria weixii]
MASVFLLLQAFTLQQISAFLTSAMVGGFVVQLPLARLSDKFGRRNAILCCSVLACAAALSGLAAMAMHVATPMLHNAVAFMFGCGLFGLYALSIARANDRLPNNMNTVEVSRSLLFCYGLGSLTAPLLLGVVMDYAPHLGFYALYAVTAGGLAAFAWKQNVVPEEERSVFVNVSGNTGVMAADLDPRNNEEDDDFDEVVAQAHVDNLDNVDMPSENEPDNEADVVETEAVAQAEESGQPPAAPPIESAGLEALEADKPNPQKPL